MTLRTLNYGNYGIFLIMGNAGFCPSTVSPVDSHISLQCIVLLPEGLVKCPKAVLERLGCRARISGTG